MHDSDPDGQPARPPYPDAACTQCHESHAGSDHTHHDASSEGSRGYGCPIPRTTYGLLKAIRSHTITNPSPSETADLGRPNPCNLCHLGVLLVPVGAALVLVASVTTATSGGSNQ